MLGARFSARVHAAIAGGALLLAAGCFVDEGQPPEGDATGSTTGEPTTGVTASATTTAGTTTPSTSAPRLVSIAAEGDTLLLTFSEPIAPLGLIDEAQFRLSAAIVVPGPKTYYYDPGPWNLYCYDPMMEYCYQVDLDVQDVYVEAEGTELYVELDYSVLPGVCTTLAAKIEMLNGEGALYLHYRAGPGQLVDADGEAVASFGATWVTLEADDLKRDGDRPELDPAIPIPCPS